MSGAPSPPRTTPAPRPPSDPRVLAHTILTALAVLSATLLVALGRLDPRWYVGIVAMAAGWLTPALVLQLLRAYQHALASPPPSGPPPPSDPPPLPPPGTLALLALLGPLSRAARHLVLGAVLLSACAVVDLDALLRGRP